MRRSALAPIQPLSPAPEPLLSSGRPLGGGIEEVASEACLQQEQRELHCSMIALTVKLALGLLIGVSLVQLAGAYQERMERQGELTAVLDLELGKLNKARERFDQLFSTNGEQRLIREQNQWIAPNRMRVVWREQSATKAPGSLPTVEPSQPIPPWSSVAP